MFVNIRMLLFGFILATTKTNAHNNENNGDLMEMAKSMQQQMQQLQTETTSLKHQLRTQSVQHENIVNQLRDENLKQQNKIDALQQTVVQLISDGTTAVVQKPEPSVQNVVEAYGCLMDTLSLSCPDERRIAISNAIYGQYATTCGEECCAPETSQDCFETVYENSFSDWAVLLQICNNKTSCDYVYNGAIINECQAAYVADYMQISYNCLPEEDGGEVVGFTAYATDSYRYTFGDIIRFEGIISNFGGHFDIITRTFTCPFNGVYMFEVGFHPYVSESQALVIYLDEDELIEAFADELAEGLNRASGFVITMCNAGQEVNVRAGEDNNGVNGAYKRSQFSGYMLHRYA